MSRFLSPGEVLKGRYRIVERLGSGRASATYRVEDLDDGVARVVKELSVGEAVRTATGADSYDSDDFTKIIELFEREARALAHLEHPGIPAFVEHFSLEASGDTRLYTVQELVEGETLEALVEGGRHFTEAEVRRLAEEAARVLAYIHGHAPPFVHRDIKPGNLVLAPDGTVHLVDFGSVRTDAGVGAPDGKTIVGTFGYMPLEQYEGRASPASDVFALGGTLLYALTHAAPHELPRSGLHIDFRRFANVSDGFAELIERMVEPDAAARYRDGSELLAALAAGERAVPAPRTRPAAPAEWRPPAVAGITLLACLFVLFQNGLLPFQAAPDAPAVKGPPPAPLPGGTRVEPPPEPEPARAANGVLAVDIYRNFSYSDDGWPMGRSVGQTSLGELDETPRESLMMPALELVEGTELLYGALPLGNGPDGLISFALLRDRGGYGLLVDSNNDEDLRNDGGVLRNQGSGDVLGARIAVVADVAQPYGPVEARYDAWIWFNRNERTGRYSGRFYGRNHWRGQVSVGDASYEAIAYEERGHDALYRDAGLCIDLDRDERCDEERELFHDGEVVPFPEGPQRLELRFP